MILLKAFIPYLKLKDESLRKRTIEKGKNWVRNFTWERAAKQTMKV
jgi:hypothetical protein